MTPDDDRPRTPAADDAPSSAQGGDEPAGDDLESLAGALPSPSASEAPPEGDEELDLGALAAVGGQRPSAQQEVAGESDGRVSLAARSESVAPPASQAITAKAAPSGAASLPAAATPARPAWLLPLLLGLGIGAGAAAAVFFAMSPARLPAADASTAAHEGEVTPSEPGAALPEPTAAPPLPSPQADTLAASPAVATSAAPAPEPAPGSRLAPVDTTTTTMAATQRSAAAQAPALERSPASGTAAEPQSPSGITSPSEAAAELGSDPLADDEAEAPADKAAAPADASAKTTSSMDALLDQALSPQARRDELARRQQLALAAEQLPLTPGREDVTQAMTVLLPAIRGCAMGQSGMATASIVVRNDGRVAGVEITGAPFAGTASGRCMEGVIRRARFTPFRQPILRVKFPLAIQ